MAALLLLACLLAPRQASAQGVALRAKDGPFQTQAARAFARVQSYAKLNVAVRYVDGKKEKWCGDIGAAALEGSLGTPGNVDTVFLCSELKRWKLDDDQLFYVIAHEMGHLALRHTTQIDEKQKELVDLLTIMRPKDVADAKAWIAEKIAPMKLQFEKEADHFAVDLMRQAGIDPRRAVDTINRGADIDGPRSAYLDAVVRERVRSILRPPLRILITPKPHFD